MHQRSGTHAQPLSTSWKLRKRRHMWAAAAALGAILSLWQPAPAHASDELDDGAHVPSATFRVEGGFYRAWGWANAFGDAAQSQPGAQKLKGDFFSVGAQMLWELDSRHGLVPIAYRWLTSSDPHTVIPGAEVTDRSVEKFRVHALQLGWEYRLGEQSPFSVAALAGLGIMSSAGAQPDAGPVNLFAGGYRSRLGPIVTARLVYDVGSGPWAAVSAALDATWFLRAGRGGGDAFGPDMLFVGAQIIVSIRTQRSDDVWQPASVGQ